jgi:hypothetical protein
MNRPPSENFETMREFEHPTIGYWLRLQIPGQPFAAQFLPLGLALAVAFGYCLPARPTWSWERVLPWLVLASILTAGYGAWAFDLVILLTAIIPTAVWIVQTRRTWLIVAAAALFLALNFLVLTTIREAGSQSNPWIAPTVLSAYVVAALARNKTAACGLASEHSSEG